METIPHENPKSNKIGWCDLTLNVISGCKGPQGKGPCDYCFANDFAKRLAGVEKARPGSTGYPVDDPFRPTFHADKLDYIRNLGGKHKRVFLNSMSDWFGEGVEASWVQKIIEEIWKKPDHAFLVLTKSPENILKMLHCINLPRNLWIGVSVTCTDDIWRIIGLKDSFSKDQKLFVSFEPLHGRIDPPEVCLQEVLEGISWVIMGAESGRRPDKIAPEAKWIKEICKAADNLGIPVYLKNNLTPLIDIPGRKLRQEFPEDL